MILVIFLTSSNVVEIISIVVETQFVKQPVQVLGQSVQLYNGGVGDIARYADLRGKG